MARINNYLSDSNITDNDFVIGSDGDVSGATKNFNIATLREYMLRDISGIPTKTSELTNDGEDGTNPFITAQNLPSTPTLEQVVTAGNSSSKDIVLSNSKKIKGIDSKKFFEVDATSARIVAYGGELPLPDTEARVQVETNGAVLIQGEAVQVNVKSATITGQVLNFRGLEYAADYSLDFTDRSLVDKGYVDGNIISKADLVGGKVPSEQLPSYVDDVVEVEDFASLPITGESGKIYITINDNTSYRWGGSVYVAISGGGSGANLSYTPSPTNGIVTSDSGTDATIPLADGTNAGLVLIDSFGDVVVDSEVLAPPTIGTITQPTLLIDTASVDLSGLPVIDWEIIPNPNTAGLTGLTGSTSTTTIDNLEQSTTYTFQVLSNGDLSVPSDDVVIDAQPIPTEYYVRPLGVTYGDGSGISYANAWSGFSAINWSILGSKTLNVIGTHNEELNVQQNTVTIVGNNVNGAGIIDAQNTRVCFRINGYDNITVNNLSMINGQTSNAFNMLTTGTIYNNCIFDTSGNQTAQHEGNIISDLISVTYNGCTFKNGADDGVSLHGDNTTVVLNNCSMENNSQGVNAINTGICIINDSNFLNNTTDVQPDSSSDITVNRSTFRSQLSANSSVPLKLNNCTMLSGETVITSLGSATISDTKYIGASKITSNQTDITKVIITRCYFEVNAIAKVTTINNGVYDLTYSTFKHFSGTNVYAASTGGTGTSTINNCNFIGVTSTGRGIAAAGRVNVKNAIFQGLNLCVNPNGANAIVTFEKCCTYLNTTINVNQNGGTFTNTSSVTTNPLFTDLPNLDFRLTTGSSCWNTGLTLTNSTGILSANWSTGMPTVTTKTQPATWDIGAYIH